MDEEQLENSTPSEVNQKCVNYLKVRDDHHPVSFVDNKEEGFRICKGANVEWANGDVFYLKDLRSRVEPWLTSLFQSEHLSLLIGSGMTHAVHHIAVGKPAAGMSADIIGNEFEEKIKEATDESAEAMARGESNIEDQIRVANELLRGLEILGKKEQANTLRDNISKTFLEFAQSILNSELCIVTAEKEKREEAFNSLITFLMSFASRTGTRDRLNIFTTNYDRLIEAGAELAGLHLLDRFVGNLTPIFRSSRLDLDMHYNPPGIRGEPRYLEGVARFTKLHGSVDWIQAGRDIRRIGMPFGAEKIDPYLEAPGLKCANKHELMIYPNAAKDRETSGYPYVELFRDLAAALCRPNSTLVTYGYSFGDEHINRVIHDMLTIPSTHLVVVSKNDHFDRICSLAKERSSQVSLLVGPQLADLKTMTEYFLPKAAIDRATFRMSELLRQRYGVSHEDKKDDAKSDGEELA